MNATLADAARRIRHVFLRDMLLHASIGWYPHEHRAPQRIRINVDLAVDEDPQGGDIQAGDIQAGDIQAGDAQAGDAPSGIGADELGRVVSYEVVAQDVRRIVAAGHVKLVETLAERIAHACLADPRVRLARVQVEKLDVFPDAAAAGVTVERARL